ncbi:MAG: hypothetical protein K2N28_06245 [Muribaculaceae bacterium]|nr:hypothetical protein [Muribaculaceae bacterium]
MKRIATKLALTAALIVSAAFGARAQYYQIASQLSSLISPALSGSMNYKGYVEVSGLAGLGENRANFVGISTSQGFRYSSWFFMGVGLGVDMAVVRGEVDGKPDGGYPPYFDHSSSKTRAMIPVFTDFRFNIGGEKGPSAYIDIKTGATWLMGSSYLTLQHSRLSGATQFYLKPSIGVRMPVSKTNPKQAFNVGLTYQLVTSNSNYYRWNSDAVTLNALGLSIAYEW